MSDILSGGRIDTSTDGPIPPSGDIRSDDILAAQRQRQNENSAGGLGQFSVPDQEMPNAISVSPAPPLPDFNFDFGSLQISKTDESAREAARQEVFDVLKNITINGQQPTIQGSSIAFDILTRPSASEEFVNQNYQIETPQLRPTIVQSPAQAAAPFSIQDGNAPLQPAPSFRSDGINFENIQPLLMGQLDPTAQAQPVSADLLKIQDAYQVDENIRAQISEQSFNSPIQMDLVSQNNARIVNEEINPIIDFETSDHPHPLTLPINEPNVIRYMGGDGGGNEQPNYLISDKKGDETEKEDKRKELEYKEPKPHLDTSENYRRANEPFPPLQKFRVCIDGEMMVFLIPAFGPYQDF